MPVLLEAAQAPTLAELLLFLKQQGMEAQLVDQAAAKLPIQGMGSLEHATPQEISFLSNPQLQHQLKTCNAAAVIMAPDVYQQLPAQPQFAVVLFDQPYLLYALLAQWFDQSRLDALPQGIHPSAVVDPSAQIGAGVSIGPFCVIDAHAQIGDGSRLGAGSVVGSHSQIGKHALIHPRVTLYHQIIVGDRAIIHSGAVIGADGFGFAPHPQGGWAKIAQLGSVHIGDDVEIGANTTIDRGALDNTIVGNGVKLDNQIMLGHNVHVGDHTAIAACVGVAGSTHIGARCIIGGAAMISGHLHIADDVQISGGTAVTASIKKTGRYSGVYPFAEHKQWQYNAAVISQLSQLRKRLRSLERDVESPNTKQE
ncbi:MAG TPA: UDP-3-O-(3-hydroxymyristoyl)glucosamine N-acyltransferase [Paenalcaligenes hominis]|uniref:UDP-3-O-acylglucosamine N-acyltransferase n=1 Tax=Paenalcaligenes hominis TaxID=643674 RepID=A0A9D2VEC7_9BURK|nr:UDP-3-O-(3-hydroxymyristoyl)glucosamine N-acyltransferase [Paenalcaligenes hominis]NJB64471.1 UDP-3-O-[3-hydroxymyristoyl] glucosamine N-acyltransferase [Paenalcaligenes hominis]GGE67394.1 UDP-3-O-acylglucosamine N-acyltransferase [Paenalcaligenes hominis]HJH23056.1 UDP-3-O-(3-hydroxymyristoyl)glucosamine N-acyltransferase [Paenalcaligenes hominis]